MDDRDTDDRDPRRERGSFSLHREAPPPQRGEPRPPGTGTSLEARINLLQRLNLSTGNVRRYHAWLSGPFQRFLHSCSDLLLERIGSERVRCIFLCGSFAVGEGSVVFEEERPLFLSDIDLVVVLKSIDDLHEFFPRRLALGSSCEELFPGARFDGHVEIGMMLTRDLRRLPPRPGAFDMRAAGRVLAGDPAVLDAIADYRPDDIGGREAVVLIENRIVSLLRAYLDGGGGEHPPRHAFLYRIARIYTDIATTALCLSGLYRPGYLERYRMLREVTGDAGENGPVAFLRSRLLPKMHLWTDYKLDPSIRIPEAGGGRGAAQRLLDDGARDLIGFWKRAELFLAGESPVDGQVRPVADILLSRKVHGRLRDNVRAWNAFLAVHPPMERVRRVLCLGSRFLSAAPLDLIRAHGVRLLDARISGGGGAPVPALRGGFPLRGGSWEDAAGDLYSMWSGLVFGRPARESNGTADGSNSH